MQILGKYQISAGILAMAIYRSTTSNYYQHMMNMKLEINLRTIDVIFYETYLSTESNGRLSGGGLALTFLGGASLSP